MEQQRVERDGCLSQQQHPEQRQQQLRLPPRELTTASGFGGAGQMASVHGRGPRAQVLTTLPPGQRGKSRRRPPRPPRCRFAGPGWALGVVGMKSSRLRWPRVGVESGCSADSEGRRSPAATALPPSGSTSPKRMDKRRLWRDGAGGPARRCQTGRLDSARRPSRRTRPSGGGQLAGIDPFAATKPPPPRTLRW